MHDPAYILVVEDDDGVAMVLVDTLEDEGYIVGRCRGVTEAVAKLRVVVPAVILLDLTLYDGHGSAIVRHLRESDGPLRRVPIIVVTGSHQGLDAARELGAERAVRKPFELDEVLDAVASVIGTTTETHDAEALPPRRASARTVAPPAP
jgi:CheY-like chemotaxis protein